MAAFFVSGLVLLGAIISWVNERYPEQVPELFLLEAVTFPDTISTVGGSGTRDESHGAGNYGQVAIAQSIKVNLNEASLQELEELPGIGVSLSRRIIAFRDEQGTFSTPEDILQVKGIGPAKFSRIKDLIIVR